MGTNAAVAHGPLDSSGSTRDDVCLLKRLSAVYGGLDRYKREARTARARLGCDQTRIARVGSLLGADVRALAALHTGGAMDRCAIDLLESAVSDGQLAYESARLEATHSASSLWPLLTRLYLNLASLERDRDVIRAELSSVAFSTYEQLVRRNVMPFVSYLTEGSCEECGFTLPTAFVSSIFAKKSLLQCPSCARVLVSLEPTDPSMR